MPGSPDNEHIHYEGDEQEDNNSLGNGRHSHDHSAHREIDDDHHHHHHHFPNSHHLRREERDATALIVNDLGDKLQTQSEEKSQHLTRESANVSKPLAQEEVHDPAEIDSSDPTNHGCTLYIRNLPTQMNNEEVKNYFSRHGEIVDCRIVINPVTKESRGFGFVSYRTSEMAEHVMATMDQTELDGRVLRIERARRNRPHDPTPGEYKGPTGASIKYDNRGRLKPGYVPYWDLPVPRGAQHPGRLGGGRYGPDRRSPMHQRRRSVSRDGRSLSPNHSRYYNGGNPYTSYPPPVGQRDMPYHHHPGAYAPRVPRDHTENKMYRPPPSPLKKTGSPLPPSWDTHHPSRRGYGGSGYTPHPGNRVDHRDHHQHHHGGYNRYDNGGGNGGYYMGSNIHDSQGGGYYTTNVNRPPTSVRGDSIPHRSTGYPNSYRDHHPTVGGNNSNVSANYEPGERRMQHGASSRYPEGPPPSRRLSSSRTGAPLPPMTSSGAAGRRGGYYEVNSGGACGSSLSAEGASSSSRYHISTVHRSAVRSRSPIIMRGNRDEKGGVPPARIIPPAASGGTGAIVSPRKHNRGGHPPATFGSPRQRSTGGSAYNSYGDLGNNNNSRW